MKTQIILTSALIASSLTMSTASADWFDGFNNGSGNGNAYGNVAGNTAGQGKTRWKYQW